MKYFTETHHWDGKGQNTINGAEEQVAAAPLENGHYPSAHLIWPPHTQR